MQFSLRFILIGFVVLAVLLAEWTSGLSIISDSLWALTPAVLVTSMLLGPRPDRIAAAAALATFLALHFPRASQSSFPFSLSQRFPLPLVVAAWWVSRWWCRRMG